MKRPFLRRLLPIVGRLTVVWLAALLIVAAALRRLLGAVRPRIS